MKVNEIKSGRTGDSYFELTHPTGLRIFVYPKEGYHSTYAIFGAQFGSINTAFRKKGEEQPVETPAGIAHFLEHKLFESEDGDAFERYAKTGASANAFTSFDMTCYLFSCTENFKESLEILLDFVQSPYFTEKTVQKEQGIIGQEIRMYDDDPNWRVMFNLLGALYHNHPLRVDIAGTVESISEITADLLYRCYYDFYNLHNMVLSVAGKVSVDEVISLCDKLLKPGEPMQVESIFPDEPKSIREKRVEQRLSVAVPLFQLGFKEEAGEGRADEQALAETDILLELMASKASPLYRSLMDAGLINASSFSYEYFEGPGYASVIFSGESRDPDKVAELIRREAARLHREGIDPAAFETARRAVYGKTLSALNSPDNLSNLLAALGFAGRELFRYIDCVAEATPQSVEKRLERQLLEEYSALSVVSPVEE